MKWFKHHTDALDDPFIHDLMDEFSHLGYAVWFGLIEIIAKENGSELTGSITISPAFLGRKLRTTPTKVRQVLDFCQTNARLSSDLSGKKWEIHFPKIAKIKDNYTKDLQESCKKLSIEKEKEKEKKKKKKDLKNTYGEFENVNLTPVEHQTNIPEWMPSEAWNGFIEMRKKSKTPFTERAIKLTISELERLKGEGQDVCAVLNQSVTNGWKGVFPIKQGAKAPPSQMDKTISALERAREIVEGREDKKALGGGDD